MFSREESVKRIVKMGIEELYRELDRAYSDENLNLITGKLIQLYKNRNYNSIREIADKVLNGHAAEEQKDAKLFSRLMMLYHPDKGDQLRENIRRFYHNHDLDNLNKFAHVLLIKDIDRYVINYPDDDIDYNPEYSWEFNSSDDPYSDYTDYNSDAEDSFGQVFDYYFGERNVYFALRMLGFGVRGSGFTPDSLILLEELDFARNGLHSLEGLEICCHARYLDASNNELSDITSLVYLTAIEELYLENNRIDSTESLGNLSSLRILDLSGNYINDISPLFELESLEFVNLKGNPVPECQVEILKQKAVLVLQ